jgi:hypothetical protein
MRQVLSQPQSFHQTATQVRPISFLLTTTCIAYTFEEYLKDVVPRAVEECLHRLPSQRPHKRGDTVLVLATQTFFF